MRYLLLCLIYIISNIGLQAQKSEDKYVTDPLIQYEDAIYKDYISSVKFNIIGSELTQPFIDLADGQLSLNFDDLDADVKDLYYTIEHCNKDWEPSDGLTKMDYIDGFTEEELVNYEYSINTLQPYTNYSLLLPNENMRWKLSGNYVLKVFTDEGEDDLVLTRRFIVVDPKLKITAEVTQALSAGKMDSHQEIDFSINYKGMDIVKPSQEVSVSIIQNGMWSGMQSNIKPSSTSKEVLEYDYQGKITFPGLKEFRFLDMRSFRSRTEKIAEIRNESNGTDVELMRDPIRAHEPYFFEKDMNGNFFIENIHEKDNDLMADYALTTFRLGKDFPFDSGQVYLIGKMTDWKLQNQYKMQFNKITKSYETKVYLKNGYYNYLFAYTNDGSEKIDYSEIEGNTNLTENEYTIIVYYTPFAGRYDQVIALTSITSLKK